MTTSPENSARISRKSWVFLSLIILFVVFVRVRLSDFPLERDEGEYAYMGQLILQGVPPYIGAYNMKFPGTYAMFALIMAVFGQSIQGIHLGFMLVNCVTILLVFLLAKKFVREAAAVAAAAAYALLSLSSTVLGFAAHATHFVMLPALGGVLTLLIALRKNRFHVYFLSGILFGLSLLMKQPGVFFLLFGATYIIWNHFFIGRGVIPLFPSPVAFPNNPPSSPLNLRGEQRGVTNDRARSLKELAINLAVFTAGGALPLLLTVVYLQAVGAFDKFWFWTVEYASRYAAQVPLSSAFGVFEKNMADVAEGHWLFWTMALGGFIGMFFYKDLKSKRAFVALFAFFSFLTICPGFYFRQHYFITLLPAVSILTGIFIDLVDDKAAVLLKTRYAKFAGIVIFILAAGAAIASERGYLFSEDPAKLSRSIYGPNPFPESIEISRFISSRSAKTDRVAVFGSEPQIYFYSGRHAATGYIYTYGLMENHPYALGMQKEMIREIESAKPKFIMAVFIATSWLMRPESEKYILGWFDEYVRANYRLVGVADIISDETTVYKWHTDAEGYVFQSPNRVLIFEKNGK